MSPHKLHIRLLGDVSMQLIPRMIHINMSHRAATVVIVARERGPYNVTGWRHNALSGVKESPDTGDVSQYGLGCIVWFGSQEFERTRALSLLEFNRGAVKYRITPLTSNYANDQ